MAILSSLVVSFVHISPGAGAICEKGTSTRFESMLLLPILWTSFRRELGIRRRFEHQRPARLRLGTEENSRARALQHTLLLRRSSGQARPAAAAAGPSG
jgi:hypothetical protein